MKILKRMLSQFAILGVLIFIQIAWIFLTLFKYLPAIPFFDLIILIMSLSLVLYIVNKEDDAGYKMSWIVLILVLPFFGILLYLTVGNKRPTKLMKKNYEEQVEKSTDNLATSDVLMTIEDKRVRGQMEYLVNQGFPVYKDNETTYYSLGDYNYPDLLVALKRAKHFIFMEYFIVEEGKMFNQILDILKEKVIEGVEVRFMYDDAGSLTALPYGYHKLLESYGIRCAVFNPVTLKSAFKMNSRDHRKITVIDGTVGFSGGLNLADEYINERVRFGHWKDTGIKIVGEAVYNLTLMFLATWNATKGEVCDFDQYHPRHYDLKLTNGNGYVIPYADSPLDNEPVGENVYLNMINQAKDYLYIFTPYLIIDEKLQTALTLAVKRGVDVRIGTPGIPDKKTVFRVTRSYYEPLIDHGVKIYEYTPGFLHAKCFICDDEIATVGTINLDYRSLYLHFECGVYLYKTDSIKEIKEDFLKTYEVSKKITKETVVRGKFRGLFESFLRLFAPLM